MNNRKIAFIIYVNEEAYYNESIRYIQELYVPNGYDVEILEVWDEESVIQAYCEGMHASDAKYKVYLLQNTFILNRFFIQDALEIFAQNDKLGMLGVIGGKKSREAGETCWDWFGNIVEYDGRCIADTDYLEQPKQPYALVDLVDNALFMTQYDVGWDENVKDNHAYSMLHSVKMRKAGYLIAVPYQREAWCYCDRGIEEQEHWKRTRLEEQQRLLSRYMELDAYDELFRILDAKEDWAKDTRIREIRNLMEIYILEENSASKVHSEWFSLQNWDEMYAYYMQVRFTLIRLAYEREDERIAQLEGLVAKGKISKDAIRKVANCSLTDTSPVFQHFWKLEEEGPLVSVCLSVYNGEDFIKETIDSILNQTYQNMEIIIVDDCSTDNSRAIISSYEDLRIKPIFLEENGNVCRACNIAFAKATGKYIAATGHDDIWKPDKIEKQVAFMEEHPRVGVCFTWTDFVDEKGNIVNNDDYRLYLRMNADNRSTEYWLKSMVLNKTNWACAPSSCIRKDTLEQVGYFRYGLVQSQDYDLWLRILCEAPIYVLQEKLTLYRRFKGRESLSFMTQSVQNAVCHEIWWSVDDVISHMKDEKFVTVFKEKLRNVNVKSHKAILCEKAFLLGDMGCCFAEKHFMELLEDEECREILKKEYHFTLNDFYKMNKKGMYFDYSFYPFLTEEKKQNWNE